MDAHTNRVLSAFDVRRIAWWSVLNAPTAGVSYGAHGIWSWQIEAALPMSHSRSGIAPPWSEAIAFPGSQHMKVLAEVLTTDNRPWWKLRPAPDAITSPPTGAQHRILASRAGDSFFVAYLPAGGTLALDLTGLKGTARWVDPTTGACNPAMPATGASQTFTSPPHNASGDLDFVLLVAA